MMSSGFKAHLITIGVLLSIALIVITFIAFPLAGLGLLALAVGAFTYWSIYNLVKYW